MYFKNRIQAGEQLATRLLPHKGQKNVVIAVNDGSVLVGGPIAKQLSSVLTLLLTEAITVPGEAQPIGYINQEGEFVPNKLLSQGQQDAYTQEYRNHIEQEKQQKFHAINALISGEGFLPHDKLRDSNIILVSDGLSSGPLLDSIVDFLKPIRIQKLIIALPIACITTVDRIHMYADEIQCLGVAEYFMGTNHYYEDNAIPPHKKIVDTISTIVQSWT